MSPKRMNFRINSKGWVGGRIIFNPNIYVADFGPLNRAFWAWNYATWFSENGGGVKCRLELFWKFIRFGDSIRSSHRFFLPLLSLKICFVLDSKISNRLANFGEVENVGTSKSFYSGFELVDLSPNFHNVQQFISLLTLF